MPEPSPDFPLGSGPDAQLRRLFDTAATVAAGAALPPDGARIGALGAARRRRRLAAWAATAVLVTAGAVAAVVSAQAPAPVPPTAPPRHLSPTPPTAPPSSQFPSIVDPGISP